jgi:hypothetical protein
MLKALCAISTVVLAILATVVAPARAEVAIDIFGGMSWTKSTDVAVDGIDNSSVNVRGVLRDVEVDRGYTVGLRFGYWLQSLPYLGFGLDAFYFSLPVPAQTVNSTVNVSGSIFGKPISSTSDRVIRLPSFELPSAGASPQIMLRWPLLVSNDAPQGRVQPYLGVGPAGALTIDTDEVKFILGGLIRTGVSYQLFRHLSLFAEYRY